ncbi:MAG: glutamine synthetase type III, partial [Bacillota bacterium]|nr:glutamine synthetase type III [Bacillota bacterium]
VEEAARRGLPNIANTVDAIAVLKAEKNLALMEKHAVLSRIEMESRCEILYENYIKTINIEALTMIEMAKRQIVPAVIAFKGHLADTISSVDAIGCDVSVEKSLCDAVSQQFVSLRKNLTLLETSLSEAGALHGDTVAQAAAYRDLVFTAMGLLRQDADKLEELVDAKFWPFPTYSDMLFNV